jgi:hypothetical protein
LGDRSDAVRDQAIQEAETHSPATLAHRLRNFDGVADPQGNRSCAPFCMGVLTLPIALFALASVARGGWTITDMDSAAGLAVVLVLGACPLLLVWENQMKRKRTWRIVEALTRCSNKGAAGALLVATMLPETTASHPLFSALADRLNQFRPGDHALLSWDERMRLFGLLQGAEAVTLKLQFAIVAALSVHADSGALDCVRNKRAELERLGDLAPVGDQLVTALVEAEKSIEANLVAQRNAKILLRPVAGLETDSLLRPAGAAAIAPDTLLRSSAAEAVDGGIRSPAAEQPDRAREVSQGEGEAR